MAKNRILTLLGFLIFLFLVSALSNNLIVSNNSNSQHINNQNTNDQTDSITDDEINPKVSKSWVLPYLYIKNNWSDAKDKRLCTGFGLPWNPFVIENITIDASNSPYGSGIFIENSNNAFFTIRNCTIYNQKCLTPPAFGAAIFLYNSSFSTIVNNNCSNSERGIVILGGNYTKIANNIVKNCDLGIGITGFSAPFYNVYNCTVYGNNMTNCGMSVDGSFSQLKTYNVSTSNLVNQKSVYFYLNKLRIDSSNFTDPGQIILRYCNHTEISNLYFSYSTIGISLNNCLNITIDNCNYSYNAFYGIGISNSYNVSVKNCQMKGNGDSGIYFAKSYYCNISFNYFECDSTAIWLYGGDFNEIKSNTMIYCGIYIDYREIPLLNNVIDVSNTVNSKLLYYYRDTNILSAKDFKVSGQVILVNCNDSIVSDLNVSRGSYGILVYNSQNVTIWHNNVSFCKETGIFAYTSNNITISNNNADYCKNGIKFDTGKDVNITDNSISYNNETGLQLLRVDYTQILNNTISYNDKEGLKIEVSNYSNITKSVITNNALDGIFLHCDYYFNLENNSVDANNDGITLSQTHFSTIMRNKIVNNARYGAYIDDSDADSCDIYNNSFVNSGVKNAYDIYGHVNWYKEMLGNYWSDYIGTDPNDDGIGTSPYVIYSSSFIEDKYPIFWDPPEIMLPIIEPKVCGKNSPDFGMVVIAGKNDTTWYTLGNNPIKYIFTGTEGKVNQTGWDTFGNGTVTIHFYANDSRGYIGVKDDIPWQKDIIAPEITINIPVETKVYNSTAPYFDITITEPYLDHDESEIWYRLWNGTHWSINYTLSDVESHCIDQINQDAWNDCPNGTLTIQFFANDSVENLGNSTIIIHKDIIGPVVVITKPLPGELFNATAPDDSYFDVSFSDGNGLNSYCYVLINGTNGADYTSERPWNGKIDQEVWDEMDNGTVIIRIFAKDSLGNVGSSDVLVRKDIVSLYLKILTPVNGTLLGIVSPDFSLVIGGLNLDTLWYMLINATNDSDRTNNYTLSESLTAGFISDTIDQTFWNEMDNGNVIIRFFLNNTSGQKIWREVIVRKDAIIPNITIVEPKPNQEGSGTAPAFVVKIIEQNNDTYWYRLLHGTHYSASFTFTSNGTINQTAWAEMCNAYPLNYITIIFYCNDTAGNIGSANVSVLNPGMVLAGWIPPISDDDDDGKKKTEGFDIEKFLTSPMGMGIVGGSTVGSVAGAIFLKKRVSAKKILKKVKRIKDMKKEL